LKAKVIFLHFLGEAMNVDWTSNSFSLIS